MQLDKLCFEHRLEINNYILDIYYDNKINAINKTMSMKRINNQPSPAFLLMQNKDKKSCQVR